MADDPLFRDQRTEAGALLRSGLDLVTQMEIPPGKTLVGVVVADKDSRVLGFAVRTGKGWEFHGQVSQEVAAGKKGIRATLAVVI
jgi:hypothetical protein